MNSTVKIYKGNKGGGLNSAVAVVLIYALVFSSVFSPWMYQTSIAASIDESRAGSISTQEKANKLQEAMQAFGGTFGKNERTSLAKALEAYQDGDESDGRFWVSHFLMQIEGAMDQPILGRADLSVNERKAVLSYLEEVDPAGLSELSQAVVSQLEYTVTQLHQKVQSSWTRTQHVLSWKRIKLINESGWALAKALKEFGKIFTADQKGARYAKAFFLKRKYFIFQYERNLAALLQGYSTFKDRSDELISMMERFKADMQFASDDAAADIDAGSKIIQKELSAEKLKIWVNRENAQTVGLMLMVASLGSGAVLGIAGRLAIGLGSAALNVGSAPALISGLEISGNVIFISTAGYDLVERSEKGRLLSLGSLLDVSLILLCSRVGGVGKGVLSKLEAKIPQALAGSAKVGYQVFSYARKTAVWGLTGVNSATGLWMFVNAKRLSDETGESAASFRLKGAFLMGLALVGSVEIYKDTKLLIKSSSRKPTPLPGVEGLNVKIKSFNQPLNQLPSSTETLLKNASTGGAARITVTKPKPETMEFFKNSFEDWMASPANRELIRSEMKLTNRYGQEVTDRQLKRFVSDLLNQRDTNEALVKNYQTLLEKKNSKVSDLFIPTLKDVVSSGANSFEQVAFRAWMGKVLSSMNPRRWPSVILAGVAIGGVKMGMFMLSTIKTLIIFGPILDTTRSYISPLQDAFSDMAKQAGMKALGQEKVLLQEYISGVDTEQMVGKITEAKDQLTRLKGIQFESMSYDRANAVWAEYESGFKQLEIAYQSVLPMNAQTGRRFFWQDQVANPLLMLQMVNVGLHNYVDGRDRYSALIKELNGTTPSREEQKRLDDYQHEQEGGKELAGGALAAWKIYGFIYPEIARDTDEFTKGRFNDGFVRFTQELGFGEFVDIFAREMEEALDIFGFALKDFDVEPAGNK